MQSRDLTKIGREIGGFSPTEKQTLVKAGIIPGDLPNDIILVFARVCSEKGLSPFSRQIYITGYRNRKTGEVIYSIITGIDGFRSIAARTGKHAGTDDAKFNLQPDGQFMTAAQFAPNEVPASATVTVYKVVAGLRVPFTHTARFDEFASTNIKTKWPSMPCQMIGKVAEAFALRKAFPEEFSGIHTEEEAAAFEGNTVADANAAGSFADFEDLTPKEGPLDALKDALNNCKDLDDLTELWERSPEHQKDKDAKALFAQAKGFLYRQLSEHLAKMRSEEELKEAWANAVSFHNEAGASIYEKHLANLQKAANDEK